MHIKHNYFVAIFQILLATRTGININLDWEGQRETEQIISLQSVNNFNSSSSIFHLFSSGPPCFEQDNTEIKSKAMNLCADGEEQRPQHHSWHSKHDVCVLPFRKIGHHVIPQIHNAKNNRHNPKDNGAQHVLFEQETMVLWGGAPANHSRDKTEEPGILPWPRVRQVPAPESHDVEAKERGDSWSQANQHQEA